MFIGEIREVLFVISITNNIKPLIHLYMYLLWATVFSQLGTCSSMVRVLPQCARVPGFETWSGYVLLLPRHTNNVYRRNKGSFICYKYNQ